jgi:hypothetical protein
MPPDVRRWLCPAVEGPFIFLGYALWYGLWPSRFEGLSPNQGHSPEKTWLLPAGHSHRAKPTSAAKPNLEWPMNQILMQESLYKL